jgi:hypothetical protein
MTASAAAALLVAIVAQEPAAMRAAPRANAPKQALLWRGEWLEVRGERRDYLEVYNHRLERPGFIHRSLVRQHRLVPAEAPALGAVVSFLRESPGLESLGIGYVALYLRAVSAADLAAEPFDALGTMARRLGERASASVARTKAQRHLAAHLDVARSYGIRFFSRERGERNLLCYDGAAFRRVLAFRSVPQAKVEANQVGRAVLALTDPTCDGGELTPDERRALLASRLKLVSQADPAQMLPYLANRVRLRRSQLAALQSYERARAGQLAEASRASREALNSFLRLDKAQLAARDRALFDRTALQVAALRWAREPIAPQRGRLRLAFRPRDDGQTCVQLRDRKKRPSKLLYERCTYGLVWPASVRVGPRRKQLALAVQQLPGWVETWVFRQVDEGWLADTLVPATTEPELGYVEVAGWTPGGKHLLVVREALVDGRLRRRFQSLRRSDLSARVNARSLQRFASFKRWKRADWQERTLALR